jgi:hypothetical protein
VSTRGCHHAVPHAISPPPLLTRAFGACCCSTRELIFALQQGTLIDKWFYMPLSALPDQPLKDIRDYLGVECALYFAFIQFLASWMLVLGLLGIVPALGWVWFDTMDNWLATVYSFVALLSCFIFDKMWVQRNKQLAYMWNVENADSDQGKRFQFVEVHPDSILRGDEPRQGSYTHDDLFIPTTAQKGNFKEETKMFDRTDRMFKTVQAWICIFAFMAFSFSIILLVLSLRVYLMTLFFSLSWSTESWLARVAYESRVSIGSLTALVFSMSWTALLGKRLGTMLAEELTNYENHRTEFHHDRALLYKKFGACHNASHRQHDRRAQHALKALTLCALESQRSTLSATTRACSTSPSSKRRVLGGRWPMCSRPSTRWASLLGLDGSTSHTTTATT